MVPDYLFKVAKKKQNFGKVARSCSSTKKLLQGQKVAKKLPSTIWLCLSGGGGGGAAVGDIEIPNIEIFRSAPIARPYFQDSPTFRLEKFRTPPNI